MLNGFCGSLQMRRGMNASCIRVTADYTAHESFIRTETSTPAFHVCLIVRSVLMPACVPSAEKDTSFKVASA